MIVPRFFKDGKLPYPTPSFKSFLTVLPAVILTAGGLLLLFFNEFGQPIRLFTQAFAWILGLLALIFVRKIDFSEISHRFAFFSLFALSAVLIATAFLGEGPGNQSWIRISWLFFDIQPSEIGKAVYVFLLAHTVASWEDAERKGLSSLRLAITVLLPILGVLLQKDVGNAAVYLVIALVMLFLSSLPLWFFAALFGMIAALTPVLWSLLGDLRQHRILSGFFPDSDPFGLGWQSLSAQRILTEASLTGSADHSATNQLPALQTDMIFVSVLDRAGWIGGFAVLLLLFLFLFGLCRMGLRQTNRKKSLLCYGASAWVAIQSLTVLAMTLGLCPIVGITLPFLSYGGSSLFSLYLMLALLFPRTNLNSITETL